jgi:ABC-type enterochelin transport system permease subunit
MERTVNKRPSNTKAVPKNTIVLLAAASMAVSNMFVGIATQNRFLIAASALLAAAFAGSYVFRTKLFVRTERKDPTAYGPRMSIWVFPTILFIALPALMVFMNYAVPNWDGFIS